MKPQENHRASGKLQRKRLSRRRLLLALALILLGQLNLLAHQHEVSDAHSGDCLVCTHLHAQGHGLTGPAPVFPASIPESFPVVFRITSAAVASPDAPNARAPPLRRLA